MAGAREANTSFHGFVNNQILRILRFKCYKVTSLLSGFNILKNALALVCIIGSYNGKDKTFLRYLDEIEH